MVPKEQEQGLQSKHQFISDAHQTADLASCEGDVLISNDDLKLLEINLHCRTVLENPKQSSSTLVHLAANSIWLRPEFVIFSHDLSRSQIKK